MYFVFRGWIVEKTQAAAFCSFFAGCVFFIGFLGYLIKELSFVFLISQLSKLTIQSNLFALVTSGLYIFKPNHRWFSTNILPIISVTLLSFAGIGFWVILFPIYFIDLGDYLIPEVDKNFSYISVFFGIWDHTVTQIIFLFFFYYVTKKANSFYLTPINTKSLLSFLYIYYCAWVLLNVIISFTDITFPTYGILTNFNPNSSAKIKFSGGEDIPIFGIRSLMASHLACLVLIISLSLFFSWMSIKMRFLSSQAAQAAQACDVKTLTKPFSFF